MDRGTHQSVCDDGSAMMTIALATGTLLLVLLFGALVTLFLWRSLLLLEAIHAALERLAVAMEQSLRP